MNQQKHPYPAPAKPDDSDDYAPAVESLSDKWRDIQTPSSIQQSAGQQPTETSKRNSTWLGVGIGVALVVFLALVGGFLLLVWTVNR